MAEKRKFCRFNKYWEYPDLAIKDIPEGGFLPICIRCFDKKIK